VSDGLPLFRHREWNQYLYASFSSKLGHLYYMASLGAEGIRLKAGDKEGHYFKPRASAALTYAFNDNNSLQFNYALTNTAPEVGQLNPYNTSTDSLVVVKGNPDLRPMQSHALEAAYTFNTAGLYLTPDFGYNIYSDIIEPYGQTLGGIYFSSYRNDGHKRDLYAGGGLSYRFGSPKKVYGRIYANAYHYVDYFAGQSPKKSFSLGIGFTPNYRKWTLDISFDYRNYSYTAVSRLRYKAPNFSYLQLMYHFTKNFYLGAALQYFTGAVRTETATYGDSYTAFLSQKMLDQNFRPWLILRYTFRRNARHKIKLGNGIIKDAEKGISL
jgi:outer membrane receptor protein involved in Fe transport